MLVDSVMGGFVSGSSFLQHTSSYSTVALTNTRRANPGRQDLVIVISVRRTAGMLRSTGSRNAGMPD